MEAYENAFAIAKLLLSEHDGSAAEIVLRQLVDATRAERAFIVVRENGGFERKFDVRMSESDLTADERRFSRNLVKRAIAERAIVSSADITRDVRFASFESVVHQPPVAVMVAPLVLHEDVYGVVYLERRLSLGPFSEAASGFASGFASVAALYLSGVLAREALRRRTQTLEHDLFARYDFRGIVTADAKMLALLKVVAQVADSDATVLIQGETGTGKELIARALHVNSARSSKPFVTLHATALPGTVLESELFGHTRGAFTGADRDRPGRIASAHGGTLFLDEVAEIPLDVQAKLLRFLQFGEIQRLGSDRTDKVDVRVLAASHQDLGALVKTGRFRQDLYFRLKVIELGIPPLRDRRGDVPLLVKHFFARSWKKPEAPRWTPRAERTLQEHTYPGNVRELAHIIERACLLATSSLLDVDLFPSDVVPLEAPQPSTFVDLTGEELEAVRAAAIKAVEEGFLNALLERADGNVSEASRISGIHRGQLHKLLARHKRTG